MYGNEDGTVPATYQILYFMAWKPDKSQVIYKIEYSFIQI